MSRLRFPFRSSPSSNNVNAPAPPLSTHQKKDLANTTYWDTVESEELYDRRRAKDLERLWGLENFGNTCYCNSVLQALFHCHPFRQFVEAYGDAPAPQSALGPPPGTANFPVSQSTPASPMVGKKENPFDSLDNQNMTPTSPSATSNNNEKSRWKLGRRPTSQGSGPASLATTSYPARTPTTPLTPGPTRTFNIANTSILPPPNPEQPDPTVFNTIQTLFAHLSYSPPHQPLPSLKKDKKEETAQTASLLPSAPATNGNGNGPQGSLTTSSTTTPGKIIVKAEEPQGPPLLASLPPPSAPRGGGPFSAGSLGRGVVRPEDLLKTVKRENEMFQGMSQQDAHEFLGWVLNKVAEEIALLDKSIRDNGKEAVSNKGLGKTWVQNLFEGCLTNETRCLSCETTSSRDELFLDLSIDIEQHTSVTSCLRAFSASEMLCQKNKFFCDSCCGLQEAEKRMKIKRLPNVLALHLKRFKYQETLGRYTKLFYRVPFPLQLRLPNTTDDSENPDRLYELFAVVVHIGNGPHHGHYVCIVRSGGRWVMCDDENVEPIDENDIYRYFGDYPSGAGYVLFYQAADLDLTSLGLKPPPEPPTPPPTTTKHTEEPTSMVNHGNQMENLIEVDEKTTPKSNTSPRIPMTQSPISAHSSTMTPRTPLTVDTSAVASPIAPMTASQPSPIASSIRSTPSQSNASGLATKRTATTDLSKSGGGFTPTSSSPATMSGLSATKPKEKEKESSSKWYKVGKSKDKETPERSKTTNGITSPSTTVQRTPSSATTPSRTTPVRQATNQTISSVTSTRTDSTTFGGLGVQVPSNLVGENAENVAAYPTTPKDSALGLSVTSMTPSSGGYSNNSSSVGVGAGTSTPTSAGGVGRSGSQYGGLARQPSTKTNVSERSSSNTRDRTVSGSSQTSSGGGNAGSAGAGGYGGGGSLGRRLSGMSTGKGLLGRSGSFMKLGLGGKKDKDNKSGKYGENIEEEMKREEEKSGLLR